MGIRVDWWDKKELKDHFPHLPHTAAILSDDAAQVDVYQLTHALFQYCVSKGAKVYDTVKVQQIEHHQKGVKLVLDNDQEIKTQKLVIACGYESQNYLSQRVVRLHSSYAIVSKPMPLENPLWYENALVWESARPYLYMRTTADQRMLIGGKDETFSSAIKRDKLMARKSRELEKNARKFFPDLPFTTDYSWCGTFAETKDGLPYIGSVQEHPNTYFALGFGGNGILFSILAAQIISDQIRGIDNKDAALFAFDR